MRSWGDCEGRIIICNNRICSGESDIQSIGCLNYVQSLIEQHVNVHHIFPKKYLQKNGVNNRKDYNQIANYAFSQSVINIKSRMPFFAST